MSVDSSSSLLRLTRRACLKYGLWGTGALALPGQASGLTRRDAGPPRYWMLVLLSGGFDSLYAFDPKKPQELEPWIEVPYEWREVATSSGLNVGPLFAPLARFANKLSVLNGVFVETANHQTGWAQFLRMRTRVTPYMPTFLDLVSQRHRDPPIGTVTLGTLSGADFTSSWMGSGKATDTAVPLFDRLEKLNSGDREALRDVWQSAAARLGRKSASRDEVETSQNLLRLCSLVDKMAGIPALQAEVWSPDAEEQSLAADFQRALWLFEHDLTSSIYLRNGIAEWDSHTFNLPRQTRRAEMFTRVFSRFLAALESRRNKHGVLSSSCSIVCGSELGRHPRMNSDLGKDHFPEISLLFYGDAFVSAAQAGGAFGKTGKSMQGLPLDLRTGREAKNGRPARLDDVGASLLRIAGIDPQPYGYRGQNLPFLASRS